MIIVKEDKKKMKFDSESFGSNCPENWEEIIDYLNEKIEDGMDRDDLENIWETYCNGGYPDAPEAEF